MRKIYTRVVYDWDNDENKYILIDADCYDYNGDVVYCKGSSQPQVVQMPPQQTTSIQKAEPWGPQQDYLKLGFQKAKNLFLDNTPKLYPNSMTAEFSPETSASLNLRASRALNGSPVTAAGSNELLKTINGDYFNSPTIRGDYLHGGSGFNAAIDAAMRKAKAAVNSRFGGAGRSGSGLADAAIAESVGDVFAGLYSNERAMQESAYQNERTNQQRALAFAPQYAQQDYADIDQLAGVGSVYDQQNQAKLNEDIMRFNYPEEIKRKQFADYINAIQGNYGGTTTGSGTTTGQAQAFMPQQRGNPIMTGLSGAAGGLALGSSLGFPLLGAGVGMLSGLFDLF